MNSFELIKAVESYPELSSVLSYKTLVNYINLINYLKPTIALQQAFYHLNPPESPTLPIHEFIKVCLGMSDEAAKQAWTALRTLAWACEVTKADGEALQHGLEAPNGVRENFLLLDHHAMLTNRLSQTFWMRLFPKQSFPTGCPVA